jgi:transposase
LREILERKQINVVRAMLEHWCTCVMRSKVEPMKDVAALVRRHLGIVALGTDPSDQRLRRSHQRPVPGRQAPRSRHALVTIKIVIFLISGKLDLQAINPHAPQLT